MDRGELSLSLHYMTLGRFSNSVSVSRISLVREVAACYIPVYTNGKFGPARSGRDVTYSAFIEYAVMKCLNLIGQCEGSTSLRATVHGRYM